MKNNYTLSAIATIAIIGAGLVVIPALDNHQQQANALIFKDKPIKLKNLVKKIIKIIDRNGGSGGDHPAG